MIFVREDRDGKPEDIPVELKAAEIRRFTSGTWLKLAGSLKIICEKPEMDSATIMSNPQR
jgi:hypothetical protein